MIIAYPLSYLQFHWAALFAGIPPKNIASNHLEDFTQPFATKKLCPNHLFLGEWSDDQHTGGDIEPDKERQWGSY